MILLDTSVWIDHLRREEPELREFLNRGMVLVHPFVLGEIALGSLRNREMVLEALKQLPTAEAATDNEVVHMIETFSLAGTGIGYVDAHLLASTRLTPEALIWTRDRRLKRLAEGMQIAATLS